MLLEEQNRHRKVMFPVYIRVCVARHPGLFVKRHRQCMASWNIHQWVTCTQLNGDRVLKSPRLAFEKKEAIPPGTQPCKGGLYL